MHRQNIQTYNFSPFFRAAIGFDRMADLADIVTNVSAKGANYPPYNIEKTDEDRYTITLAVAGFSAQELTIEQQANMLVVAGNRAGGAPEGGVYLYRGIGQRSFSRQFHLDNHINVTDARLQNGLLHIELVREVPEALRPRRIALVEGEASASAKQIDKSAPKHPKAARTSAKKVA